jgi:FkbM family methyltransferase
MLPSAVDAGRRKLMTAVNVVRTFRRPLHPLLDLSGVLSPPEYTVSVRHGGPKFAVRGRVSDMYMLNDVFVHKVYGKALSRITAGELVIDIGAHVGAFTLAAAFRGARVLSFEPMPHNHAQLLKNLRINGVDDRVAAYAVAVSGSSTSVELHFKEGETCSATSFPSMNPEWSETETRIRTLTVPALSLQDIFVEHDIKSCDCVKLDCEGGEYSLFRNADRSLLRRIDTIVLEYHPNGDVAELVDILRDTGFTVEMDPKWEIMFATRDPASSAAGHRSAAP